MRLVKKEKGSTLPCLLFGLTGVAMANNNGTEDQKWQSAAASTGGMSAKARLAFG